MIPKETMNQATQPTRPLAVFNRWDLIAEGWYYVCPSFELRRKEAKSFNICGQHLAFFRGEDSRVRALDAFCPHMGTDLGIGKVVGNEIQCFFHHWKFKGDGSCSLIPCQKEIPEKANLNSYSVEEKFGFIWVFPNSTATEKILDFAGLEHEDLLVEIGESYKRTAHHHITMINGIDPQHLRSVHQLNIEMHLELSETDRRLDISLEGEIPEKSFKERLARKLLGKTYSYSMRYDHASIGLLTLLKKTHWFGGTRPLPELHMLFAYRPTLDFRTEVQPIYIAKKRSGLLGYLQSRFLIWLTKRAFFALQGEDGVIYENIRFYPNALLAIDAPVSKFIQYVNRLKPSIWSKSKV